MAIPFSFINNIVIKDDKYTFKFFEDFNFTINFEI